jgi:hypothetical protein
MNIYRFAGYAEGNEEDAISLRKSLAQSVSSEFELKRVFGVSVELDEPSDDDLVMAQCMDAEPAETGTAIDPFKLRVSIDVEVTLEDIDALMCTALEGGICYWCAKAEVVGDYLGEYAHEQISRGGKLILHDAEEEGETYELDRDKFLRGLKMFIKNGNGDLVNIKNKRIDPADFDSENADCIIQYAVFSELVYG